jgi:hypothetical protein
MPAAIGDYNPTQVAQDTTKTPSPPYQKQIQVDQFGNQFTAPMSHSIAVNVSAADQTFSPATKQVYVGGTGVIVGRLSGDTADQTFTALPVGFFPLSFTVIRHTGTTANNVVALW